MSEDERNEPQRLRLDRINVDRPSEVRAWAQVLGVTEEDIRSAVEAVGPLTYDVRILLAERGLISRRR